MISWLVEGADYDVHELKEQFRRLAHLLRLEGNYVAAQATERQMVSLDPQQGHQPQPAKG